MFVEIFVCFCGDNNNNIKWMDRKKYAPGLCFAVSLLFFSFFVSFETTTCPLSHTHALVMSSQPSTSAENLNDYLYGCNNRCTTMETCFLGKCFCLPGHAGPNCTERRVLGNLKDANLCPVWTGIDQLKKQRSFQYPVEKCNVPPWTRNPSACSIFCYWQEDAGIVSTSPHLWEVVSDAEYHHHVQYAVTDPDQLPEGQTRWGEYSHGFGNFSALDNNNLGRYLEVGAGLYTQLYNIIKLKPWVMPTSIHLVEPNIFRYVSMPQCLYKDSHLMGNRVHLLSVTTEELGMESFFDTVAVINVLEHVVDAFEFLTQVYKVLKPGGFLIFSERYFDDPVEPSSKVLGSTTLHPIRVKRGVIQHFFRLFDKVYINNFSTEESRGRNLNEKGYYFIGRKKETFHIDDLVLSSEELDRLFPP